MAKKLDELHNYAQPDNYLDELHIYDSKLNNNSFNEIHNYGNRGVTYGIDEVHMYGSYQTEVTNEDEVNKPKERELIDIDEYFDEIEYLDEEQKEERKDLAKEFRDILTLLFMLMLADLRAGNEINEGFYLSLGKSRFMGAVDRLMPSITIDIYTQIENYIHQNLTYVIESTVRNQVDTYFFSEERATAVAVDDAMASFNLDELDEAIRAGYKYKIWKAMEDNKVRKTHQAVDGKKVKIKDAFHVGRCLMQAPMIFDEKSIFEDAKEVINCRCCLIYSNKAEKDADDSISENISLKKESKPIVNLENNDTIKSRADFPMNLQFFAEKDLKNQGVLQLKKGIKSLELKITEHNDKINDPAKYINDWDKYSKEHKESLLNHWQGEVDNFKNGIEDRINELKNRGETL